MNGVSSISGLPARQTLSARPPRGSGSGTSGETAYIAGEENRLADFAVAAVIRGDALYHPLVFCGDPGTGKSHLARIVAARWPTQAEERSTKAGEGPTVLLLAAMDFSRELARLRQPRRLADWRRQLRGVELLVVEDVHLLAGRDAAQRELAATIDGITAAGGQVVVTSRMAPASQSELSPGLRSRLTAGLVVRLVPPSRSSRQALLLSTATQDGVRLDAAAAAALAAGLALSGGTLIASFHELKKEAAGGLVTVEAAKRYLAQRRGKNRLSVSQIARHVARRYRLPLATLKGPSRRRGVATARSIAMYLSRHLAGKNLKEIGDYLGGRDHSTVLHSCQKIAALMQSDPLTRAEISKLKSEMEAR